MDKKTAPVDVRSEISPEKAAMTYALKVLGASPKSRKQLQDKMRDKGFSELLIADVTRKLELAGYLNDAALAEGLVSRMSASRKGYGRRKAAFVLKRRGFDESTAASALSFLTRDAEAQSAAELGRSVWEKAVKLPELKRRKKVFDVLIRRGFDYGIAKKVTDALAGGSSEDDGSFES